ncbi:hypothetical protein [Streptomyces aurantiacus]|uniref:hypothetical protein n=1 Tax=Streptomyces aurantiacus TaxID=47760 RepID=UPI0006E3DC82|nr:hypothetical protein [Streptomyces aurantiacus]
MAMKDQFQDKSDELQRNAKQKFGERRGQETERGQQTPDRERQDRERPERGAPQESQRPQRDAGRADQDFEF